MAIWQEKSSAQPVHYERGSEQLFSTHPDLDNAGLYKIMYRVDCFNENAEHFEGVHNDFTIPTWVNVR